MAGDFNVSFVSGGIIDRIKRIDYPDSIIPVVDKNRSKGFIINTEIDTNVNDMFSVQYTAPYNLYLTSISIRCDSFGDTDYWELLVDDNPMCETMYLLNTDEEMTISFTFYEKILAGAVIKLQYYNSTQANKKVVVNMSYAYKNV